MNNRSIEMFGWVGAFCILLAYALVSFGYISSGRATFQILNFVGATGVALISFRKGAYQPALLNFLWALVAIWALAHMSL